MKYAIIHERSNNTDLYVSNINYKGELVVGKEPWTFKTKKEAESYLDCKQGFENSDWTKSDFYIGKIEA